MGKTNDFRFSKLSVLAVGDGSRRLLHDSSATWAYSLTQPRTGPCNADGVAGFLFSLLCYALPLFRSFFFLSLFLRVRAVRWAVGLGHCGSFFRYLASCVAQTSLFGRCLRRSP